jgi:hypothetical protein
MTDAARGLLISGDQIHPGNPDHAAELARICRPHDRRDDAGAGPDPRRQHIVSAMVDAAVPFALNSFDALDQTVTLRQVAIDTLTKLNTGQIDADYFDPGAGQIHPQLGGTFFNTHPTGQPPFSQPHWSNDPWWQASDLADPWGAEFDQIAGTSASDVLSQIEPFRGECAGALQIAVLTGARAALGDDAFNVQHASGSLSLVPWDDVKMYVKVVDVAVAPVPGDYFYFKNKDDYTTYAPNGFWQGLNSLYVGADRLNTARYTGLGAVFQAETELRATMANAYAGDCFPHRVTDPAKDIRFTVHAQLVLPDASQTPATKAPRGAAAGPGAEPTAAHLGSLGFVQTTPGVFEHAAIRMADLSAGLKLGAGRLRQSWSAPLVNPAYRVRLSSGAVCILQPNDLGRAAHDPDTVVRAAIRMTAPTADK